MLFAARTPRGSLRALLFALSLLACERGAAQVTGPEGSLELVRRALSNNDSSLDEHTDGRFVAEVAYMRAGIDAARMAAHGHGEHNETLNASLFERTWEQHQRMTHSARDALRPAIPWLGGGRCRNESSAVVPDAFLPLADAVENWPASLKARHVEVNARLRAVFARRFRCAPGVAMRVTFAPATAAGGAPTLLAIERD